MADQAAAEVPPRVLHAVVGHKFPGYFTNAVNSVLALTGADDVLVVDNASGLPALTREFERIAAAEPRVRLMLRDSNDISRNAKVGGLYDAYNEVTGYALRAGYDYLHIIQNDFQLVWWDQSVWQRAREIYAEYPECVNICTLAPARYTLLGGNLEYVKPRLARLQDYGLTDTGLYHLGRWRQRDMRFLGSESAHARRYLADGLCVFFHPLPTVAFIPWPAVVRGGRVKGREIRAAGEFLLRPLSPDEVAAVKLADEPVIQEDLGVPWGWTCLTPYWATDLRTIDYWVGLYRDLRLRGRAARPRWERRGLPLGTPPRRVPRRPRLGILPVIVQPMWHGARRWLAARRLPGRRAG